MEWGKYSLGFSSVGEHKLDEDYIDFMLVSLKQGLKCSKCARQVQWASTRKYQKQSLRVLYVPCLVHSLNLVTNGSAKFFWTVNFLVMYKFLIFVYETLDINCNAQKCWTIIPFHTLINNGIINIKKKHKKLFHLYYITNEGVAVITL